MSLRKTPSQNLTKSYYRVTFSSNTIFKYCGWLSILKLFLWNTWIWGFWAEGRVGRRAMVRKPQKSSLASKSQPDSVIFTKKKKIRFWEAVSNTESTVFMLWEPTPPLVSKLRNCHVKWRASRFSFSLKWVSHFRRDPTEELQNGASPAQDSIYS